jgi:predicted exporter
LKKEFPALLLALLVLLLAFFVLLLSPLPALAAMDGTTQYNETLRSP